MVATDGASNSLETRIESLGREIDTLRAAVERPSPWYKSLPTVVSALALLFSFGTTYVSYQRTTTQDIHALRLELRGLLQRLATLPKDNFELTHKYTDNPVGMAFMSSLINQENALLARQAAEIIKRLPNDQVSGTEYYSIGLALQNSYNLDAALVSYSQAVEASRDMNDEVAALRAHGNLLFLTGKPDNGRISYQRALNIFSKYKGYNDYTQASIHIWTELSWALAEANNGFFDLANQHVASAETYTSTMAPGPGTEQLKGQIAHTKSQLQSGAVTSSSPIDPRVLSPVAPEKKS